MLAALTASGLPTDTFLFGGFLPVKAGQRSSRLEALKAVPATLVFFESPRRLAESLAAMAGVLGDRPAAVARELTKTFEETRRGTLFELAATYAEEATPKGEVAVCIGPPIDVRPSVDDIDGLLHLLSQTLSPSKAAAEAARQTGLPKSDLYRRLTALKVS